MTTRAERLATLERAITEWADAHKKRLEDEAAFLRSIFDGRTNGGQLRNYIVEEASALTENEINAYLVE